MHVDTIMESRDAIFFENIFPMKDMHRNSRFSTEITPQPAVLSSLLNNPMNMSMS